MNAIRHTTAIGAIPKLGWDRREGEAILRHCDRDGNYSSSRRCNARHGVRRDHLVKLAVRHRREPQISLPFDYDHQGGAPPPASVEQQELGAVSSPTHDVRVRV